MIMRKYEHHLIVEKIGVKLAAQILLPVDFILLKS